MKHAKYNFIVISMNSIKLFNNSCCITHSETYVHTHKRYLERERDTKLTILLNFALLSSLFLFNIILFMISYAYL